MFPSDFAEQKKQNASAMQLQSAALGTRANPAIQIQPSAAWFPAAPAHSRLASLNAVCNRIRSAVW
jgi:hypothetical protein